MNFTLTAQALLLVGGVEATLHPGEPNIRGCGSYRGEEPAGFRLPTNGALGELNLYARYPSAFGAVDRAKGLVLAGLAGLAMFLAQAHEKDARRTEDLHHSLAGRELIGQAQGYSWSGSGSRASRRSTSCARLPNTSTSNSAKSPRTWSTRARGLTPVPVHGSRK